VEEKGDIALEAGKPIEVLVEYSNYPPPDFAQDDSQPALMIGVVCLELYSSSCD
jgi:beta-glucosidase